MGWVGCTFWSCIPLFVNDKPRIGHQFCHKGNKHPWPLSNPQQITFVLPVNLAVCLMCSKCIISSRKTEMLFQKTVWNIPKRHSSRLYPMFLYLYSHFNYQWVFLFNTILWTLSFLLCCCEKLAGVDKTRKVSGEESWQNEFSFESGFFKMKWGVGDFLVWNTKTLRRWMNSQQKNAESAILSSFSWGDGSSMMSGTPSLLTTYSLMRVEQCRHKSTT